MYSARESGVKSFVRKVKRSYVILMLGVIVVVIEFDQFMYESLHVSHMLM